MIAALFFVLEWCSAIVFGIGVVGAVAQGGEWFVVAVAALAAGISVRSLAQSRLAGIRLSAIGRSLGL